VLADDPQLTVRLPRKRRDPLRVVLDSYLRTPPEARVLGPGGGVLFACTEAAPPHRAHALETKGATVLRLPSSAGRVDIGALFAELCRRGIVSVLIEGGGEVAASALAAGVVDRVLFFVAPCLVGGRDAPTPVEGEGVARMQEAIPIRGMRVRRLGPDLVIEGDVHRTD
jgi:diaminohydroxyphosphoribosylaminopyrimidine deaminase/5-amino-6-(5-phosphoribosylamino)uracil reductase